MNAADAIPERIGPYIIEGLAGAGAHGCVYRAHHVQHPNDIVALKVVADRGNRDRLMLEPELLSQLNHPGIVKLVDYFIEEPDLVVVLGYVEGDTLDTVLQQEGPLSATEVRWLLSQVADALSHAHSLNILHRDIKLSNIMATGLAERKRFVLTDFGISRLSLGIQSSRQTAGTWFFMSPEQLRGRPGKQSDLWSLGVVAYRLLTGKYPFSGNSYEELSNAILYQDPPPLRQYLPEFNDAGLEVIIRDLLAKQLTERTHSAENLLQELEADTLLYDPPDNSGHTQPASALTANTLRQQVMRRIRRSWIAFWVCAILMIAPLGPVVGAAGLLAIVCFYFGHVARKQVTRKSMLGLSLAVSVTTAVYSIAADPPNYLSRLFNADAETQRVIDQGYQWICTFYYLAMAPATVHFFAKARRMRRDLERRSLSEVDSSAPDSYLRQLRMLLAWHPQDLQLQHRYAESLFAAGHVADAAVEAQLILEGDPWNFGANLLLAQSWFELNRWMDCASVCEKNLVVSGQCFEFADLRDQSLLYAEANSGVAVSQ